MLSGVNGIGTTGFINGSRTTTGTVVTIPANTYFSVDVQLACSQNGAGTAQPLVTFNTTSTAGTFSPANASTVSRLEVVGLIGIVASNSNTVEFSGYSGDNGATIDFTASGTSSCVVNGYTL